MNVTLVSFLLLRYLNIAGRLLCKDVRSVLRLCTFAVRLELDDITVAQIFLCIYMRVHMKYQHRSKQYYTHLFIHTTHNNGPKMYLSVQNLYQLS